ncbi:MAG: phenylalanine--tRNA ligase subunit beta [Flavobacteriales bacterium]|nr:phenylalanine--tRNA ligase subunit beta [Flavobacteriales bacterium]
MKISYNWLNDYLQDGFTDEMSSNKAIDLANILTSTGLEVESVSEIFSAFDHLVVGKVIECVDHPNADRLKITKVDVGTDVKQIVCGASNVTKGQFVVVILVGNKLINQKGESFLIKKTKIRGEISEGMICSADEIGWGNSHDGILELNPSLTRIDIVPGIMASDVFEAEKDYCLEIGLTPNRTDAFSHLGVCRDLYAYFSHRIGDKKNRILDAERVSGSFEEVREQKTNMDLNVKNTSACPYYSGFFIKNVNVAPSPYWLQTKLISIGLKPINNVVDITNFVLHSTGNPLHAFDYNQITDSKIIVRNANPGEKFTTLEKNSISLDKEDLVICDTEKPLCLAGVIGGVNSGVVTSTKNIFLESAYFNPTFVRKTSKRHGISSDSSYRFERGVDVGHASYYDEDSNGSPIGGCEYALRLAAQLIRQICDGEVVSRVQYNSDALEITEIDFSYDFCAKILGYRIEDAVIDYILSCLDFKLIDDSTKNNSIKLLVPSYRLDVTRPIDVVEEIARIYGYDNIPSSNLISFSPSTDHSVSMDDMKTNISSLLVSNGFFEIKNNSLIPESSLEFFPIESKGKAVQLLNPLSQDLSIMRPNMFFSGLQTIKHNLNRQINDIKIFEFGKTYLKISDKYVENEKLTIFTSGIFKGDNWREDAKNTDFFFMKGVLDKILDQFSLNYEAISFAKSKRDHSVVCFNYLFNDNLIASVGEFSKNILENIGVKKSVYYIDVNLDFLFSIVKDYSISYNPVSKFPSIKRDLSLLVNQETSYLDIENSIKKFNNNLLKSFSLFDMYQGEKVEKTKKSFAISFLFEDQSRTLTDDEVDKQMLKIFNYLQDEFQLSLRDGELS